MTSPVSIPFESIIQLDRSSGTPVYLQIAHQVINAIQRQYLPAGTRLPGTRVLAKALQVHRNTIIMACQELDAQGGQGGRYGCGAHWVVAGRRARRRIFPTLVFGSSSRNSMYFGRL